MKVDEKSLREEVTFWRELRDKFQLQVDNKEHQRLQEAVEYSEKKLSEYLTKKAKVFEVDAPIERG